MKETNITVTAHTWIIPLFGNNHCKPYGYVKVEGILNDGTEVKGKFLQIKGGTWNESVQYIIINRQRYILHNEGSVNAPKLSIEKWAKAKINGHWYYVR